MNTVNLSNDNKNTNPPCPICGGAGFLRRDVPVDHPDFGRAIPCDCKRRETQQAEVDSLRSSSGLAHLSQMTFASFRPDGIGLNPDKRKNLHQAFDCAREFAAEGKGWLLLKGGYGCGKTHLAAAIANDRLARGETPPSLDGRYAGEFGVLVENLNRCVQVIHTLLDEVDVVIQAGRAGDLGRRADATRVPGDYARILRGVNSTVDARPPSSRRITRRMPCWSIVRRPWRSSVRPLEPGWPYSPMSAPA